MFRRHGNVSRSLARRFASFALRDTGLYELYSEASLGKAYLKTMGVKPWREVQGVFRSISLA
jgi:hypothetical protein